jgi:putative aldouronate transport system substrate-binding protein
MALALCLTLFSGCGSTGTSEAASSQEAAVSAEASVSAEAPAVQEAPESAPPEEEASVVSAEEEDAEEPSYHLPISEEPLTYSLWMTYAPFAGELMDTEHMEEMNVFQAIAAETNINFDIIAANGGAEADNFNLMIAAGDYTDIITSLNNYYSGKEGAVDDGVIQDLAAVLEEKCPIYWSYLSSDTNTLMAAYTESGYMPCICMLSPEVGQESQGLVIRKDWLEEFGMTVPTTFDELTAYLEEAQTQYGAGYDMTNTLGVIQELGAGLNLNLGGFTVEDGTVLYSYAQDSFKTYLKFINNLYNENIISKDFFSQSSNDLSGAARQTFALGQNSMILTTATNTADILEYAGGDVPMVVQPYVSEDGTTEAHVLTSYHLNLMKHDDTWAFTYECEDIDPLLELVEFLYSDDGYVLANYGIEGDTYTLDENGEPQWTDYITDNPDGLSFFFASYVYATNAATAFVPFLSDLSKTFYEFNDNQWEVYEDLKNLSDAAYNLPSYVSMTSEESTEYDSLYTDVDTYAQTEILSFITGTSDIDADFDSFVSGMNDLGLTRMIELEQTAYDRAISRAAELEG